MRSFALVVVIALTLACDTRPPEPTAQDAALYFGLADGATIVLEGPGGLEETHTLDRDNTVGEAREVYRRTVRRGGFVDDDGTFFVEATVEGLFIDRFFDCVTQCGVPSAQVPVLDFPARQRAALSVDVDVELSVNGAVEQTRAESHVFQAGAFEDASVPAGSFDDAVPLVWTRIVEGDTRTLSFVFAADVGFVQTQAADGTTFAATSLP